MLPSILNVAENYNLESDPKSYGKKESLFKCPFCKEDSNKEKKFYLSLNTEKNVFKCWYCKESGGVLHFEALLSGLPFEEVREKYFGKRKKNLHPAYRLSPDQLRKIGWQQKKRDNFQFFVNKKDEVLKDWVLYVYEELTTYYALFTLIAYFPIKEQRKELYKWFVQLCSESKVDDLNQRIVRQWNSDNKKQWAEKGLYLARIAYKVAKKTGDFRFENLFVNVLFAKELMKINKLAKKSKESIS